MGRWSQSRRTGGGRSLNFMVEATQTGAEEIQITYDQAVRDGEFDPTTFVGNPGAIVGDSYANDTPNKITVTFAAAVASVTTVTWTDTNVGFVNPQTVDVT